MTPRSGDVLHVGREASVQFDGDRALTFRVTRVLDQPTYEGWAWLVGYSLDAQGAALEHREIYVQTAGLRPAAPTPTRQRTRTAPERTAVRPTPTRPAVARPTRPRAVDPRLL